MRYFSLILIGLVLAVPFALRLALRPPALRGASTTGQAERLVVITPHGAEIRNEYARAFRDWHRVHYGNEVELDFRVPGGSNDVKRQLLTTYQAFLDSSGKLPAVAPANVPADVSVVWGGGDFFFDRELKPVGILLPTPMTPALEAEFHAAFPQPTLAGVKLYDATMQGGHPTPMWIGVCLSSFGVCYNPDVYHAMGIAFPSPEHGWSDLTDPRLAGLLAMADPQHAGSAAVAYQMVIQHKMAEAEKAFFATHPQVEAAPRADRAKNVDYQKALAAGWKAGMRELLKIAANARYFTDSSTLVPTDVSRGEAAAGMVIDFYERVTEESVGRDRIQYFAPIGATAITPDPIGILYGTHGRQLELAQHLIEFLLSPEGQRLWILKAGVAGGPVTKSPRRMPIRRDVYADRTNWADDVNPFTAAKGFNQRGEWMKWFTDSRPIWVAAWIDSRDELQAAYRRILLIPDPVRRSTLIEAVADLPIELGDVEKIMAERTRLEQSHGPVDEWRATTQIAWAEKFREHYRQVGGEARRESPE